MSLALAEVRQLEEPTFPFTSEYDPALTHYAEGQAKEDYYAFKMFGKVMTPRATGSFWNYALGAFRQGDALRAAGGGMPVNIGLTRTTSTFTCTRYAFVEYVEDDVAHNSDLQAHKEAVDVMVGSAMTGLDMKASAVAADADNYATGHAVTAGTDGVRYWSDPNFNIKDEVKRQKNRINTAIGRNPTIMVVGKNVHRIIGKHPSLVGSIRQTPTGMPGMYKGAYADAFELGEYIVVDTTSEDGQGNITDVWADHAALLTVAPRATTRSRQWGSAFVWAERDFKIRSYFMPIEGATALRLDVAVGFRTATNSAGFLWRNLLRASDPLA